LEEWLNDYLGREVLGLRVNSMEMETFERETLSGRVDLHGMQFLVEKRRWPVRLI